MDPQRLKRNFEQVGGNGIDVAEYFYADLFGREPQLRPLFPAAMTKQHEKLLSALSHIVSMVDDPQGLAPFLSELGRRHSGFGVHREHYPQVGASLIATLAFFSGPDWDEDLERDWQAAYGLVAQVMSEAAAEPAA
ncbi:globin domain-containing protein [Actinomadura litoris]|uniref:globin domain-containing protein n=1 Tax=Actinomadura litoris TaxID=2678616 RepID=UPI001FA750EE|nr:globin domain-containing protein [Actinomadura litoris]